MKRLTLSILVKISGIAFFAVSVLMVSCAKKEPLPISNPPVVLQKPVLGILTTDPSATVINGTKVKITALIENPSAVSAASASINGGTEIPLTVSGNSVSYTTDTLKTFGTTTTTTVVIKVSGPGGIDSKSQSITVMPNPLLNKLVEPIVWKLLADSVMSNEKYYAQNHDPCEDPIRYIFYKTTYQNGVGGPIGLKVWKNVGTNNSCYPIDPATFGRDVYEIQSNTKLKWGYRIYDMVLTDTQLILEFDVINSNGGQGTTRHKWVYVHE